MNIHICEICLPLGQPRPTLAAATQPQPTGAPQWAPPWEDQEQLTLEAADPPSEAVDPHWVEEVLSNQDRLEEALQLVEEASCNPGRATGENSCLSLSLSTIITMISNTITMVLVISGSSMVGAGLATRFHSAL